MFCINNVLINLASPGGPPGASGGIAGGGYVNDLDVNDPWGAVVHFSEGVFDIIGYIVGAIVNFFANDLNGLISAIPEGIPFISDILSLIVDTLDIGDLTVFGFMLGAGLLMWLSLTLMKFFLSFLS